jgi:hypothetical protein
MSTFLLVFLIMVLLVAGMSVGVIFGRKPISGSCGGMSAVGINSSCDICGGNTQKCEEESQRVASEAIAPEDLAYDATKAGRKQ